MREGILGGTFDPVHLGHLRVARAALQELGLDRVVFLPDGDPPHKLPNCTPQDRLEMVRLACQGEPRFVVSDMELRRQGRTYTVDTLMALRDSDPEAQLTYLIGSDTLYQLPTWRTIHKVTALARMAIVLRPGDERGEVRAKMDEFADTYGLDSVLLKTRGLPLSSSQVRQAVATGQDISALVPPAVARYIRDKGLYLQYA